MPKVEMKTWLTLVGAILLCIAAALGPAPAAMESNPHALPAADPAMISEILALPDGRDFLGDSKLVYAEHWSFRKAEFLIVRVEDATCNGEFCPTAFISEQHEGSKIIGLGWLPKSVLYGDVEYRFCRACRELYGLSFSDTHGKEITIGISRNYLVISGDAK